MSVAVHVDQARDLSMLGASEAAGVLGLDRYNPPITVWRRHRGMPVEETPDDGAAYWGSVLEPVIRGKYALDRNATVWVPTGSYSRDGWLRCTPDGLVLDSGMSRVEEFDPNDFDPRAILDGLLQVKTCSEWLGDEWTDGPPAKYEVQCRVEMAVCGLPWNDVVCLCGGQRYLGPFRVERDLALEDRILTSLREFWQLVETGTEPSPDHTDAWRMHVGERMERAKPIAMQADEATRADVVTWRAARRQLRAAKKAEAEARNAILLRLSAAGATRIDDEMLGPVQAYKTRGTWALRAPKSWKDE